MFSSIRAWIELLKLGNVGSLSHEVDVFYRGNVIKVLKEEGWFEYLTEPHTVAEIQEKFDYTDTDFLAEILEVLEEDGTLKKMNSTYQFKPPLDESWIFPRVFEPSLEEVLTSYAKAIPSRLKGNYQKLASGFNLFNWDDALTSKLYEQMRNSAFAFAGSMNQPGKLLDVNCGNGNSTAAIWVEMYQKNLFKSGNEMEIVGIDSDKHLLEIAEQEFPSIAKRHFKSKSIEDIKAVQHYFPTFKVGTVLNIPFADEYFDRIYSAQLLHWTDAEVAIKEMFRVTKPGGIVFGTQRLLPSADKFPHLHVKTVENAQGFFYKEDFIKWAKKAGAKSIKISTPVAVFKIQK